MMRVRSDFGAENHLRASGWGQGVVPNGTTNRFLQYPALEALGYNTSPLRGCSPFKYPQNWVPLGTCKAGSFGFAQDFASWLRRREKRLNLELFLNYSALSVCH